jgi:glycosyltransferase involved in cell wall biosynthesis
VDPNLRLKPTADSVSPLEQAPLVSVIIPNYNYGRFVKDAIESVLNQTYRNIEILVVNNGSTDNSLKVLNEYRDKIIIIDQENLGQVGARNAGLRKAKGGVMAE